MKLKLLRAIGPSLLEGFQFKKSKTYYPVSEEMIENLDLNDPDLFKKYYSSLINLNNLKFREVADILNISPATAHSWANHPTRVPMKVTRKPILKRMLEIVEQNERSRN